MIAFSRLSYVYSALIMSAVLLATSSAFADNIVVNGGFEDTIPYPGEPSTIRIPVGWTLSDPETGYTAVECGAGTAHTGSCAAYFANVSELGSLSQMLSTTPGTEYVLSFYLENTFQPNQLIVDWGSTEVLNLTNIPNQPYTLYTVDVVATSTSTDLSFSGFNTQSVTYLDDVSVDTSTVPEPGTFALLGTGLLSGVGFARRRLRAAFIRGM